MPNWEWGSRERARRALEKRGMKPARRDKMGVCLSWHRSKARLRGRVTARGQGSVGCVIGKVTCGSLVHRERGGMGCARCGSTAHRLRRCPQRPGEPTKSEGSGDWGGGRWSDNNLLAFLRCTFLGSSSQDQSRILTYKVRVGRKNGVEIAIDSGASVNCMDEQLLQDIGGSITRIAPGALRYADRRPARVLGVAEVELSRGGHIERIPFWVVRGLGVGVLLGDGWLWRWNPLINWRTGDLTFSDGVKWRALENRKGRPVRAFSVSKAELQENLKEGWAAMIEEEASSRRQEMEGHARHWVQEFPDIFEEPTGIPTAREVTHTIRLREGARPYRKIPYRLSVNQKAALEAELGEFFDKGWIRPSTSEWATVPFVVPKKEGGWRVVIDYRDLNAITEMDAYSLPRVDELLQRLATSRIFSKVDLKSGFHQIPVDSGSIQFTAFRTASPIRGHTLFEWGVMPMGLSTAPSTFQRWMNLALQGLEDIIVVYLDDVMVHSPSPQQHEEDVRKVLQRFQERGMRVKESKCEFALRRVKFLGHVVEEGQIQVDEEKLTRLKEWEPPLSGIHAVRQFLGFASYYRAFIEDFATLSLPPH